MYGSALPRGSTHRILAKTLIHSMPRMNFIEQIINQKQFYWTNNIDVTLNIKKKCNTVP